MALLVSGAVAYGVSFWLRRASGEIWNQVRFQLALPFSLIQLLFAVSYFTQIIPPVPLALQHIGIYHEVAKEKGQYRLSTLTPTWYFWRSGDQQFEARAGDKVHCFMRIFSPSGFADQLQVRWLYKDSRRGWQSADAIPLQVSGGRTEGFRAHAYKSNYQPGRWRVQVETTDGREVGRIYLTIVADATTAEREYNVQWQ